MADNIRRKVVIMTAGEPTTMDQIKAGDVFYVLPAGPEDDHESLKKWLYATTDGEKLDDSGLCSVEVQQLKFCRLGE